MQVNMKSFSSKRFFSVQHFIEIDWEAKQTHHNKDRVVNCMKIQATADDSIVDDNKNNGNSDAQ